MANGYANRPSIHHLAYRREKTASNRCSNRSSKSGACAILGERICKNSVSLSSRYFAIAASGSRSRPIRTSATTSLPARPHLRHDFPPSPSSPAGEGEFPVPVFAFFFQQLVERDIPNVDHRRLAPAAFLLRRARGPSPPPPPRRPLSATRLVARLAPPLTNPPLLTCWLSSARELLPAKEEKKIR